MTLNSKFSLLLIISCSLLLSSCDDSQSYSDLLKKEQKVSNWFLAQHKVCNEIPADSLFEIGPDAPYYRIDPDGYIYMQVLKVSDKKEFPATGDQVYFTFTRYNIERMYNNNSLNVEGEGNQDDLWNTIGNTYFIYNNFYVNVSSKFGQGIQRPLSFLGYDSEVNILLKSYYGFAEDNTVCIPYLVNTRYFKAEY